MRLPGASPQPLEHYVKCPQTLALRGKIISRTSITDTIHGAQTFTALLVMNFPSKTKLQDFFNGDVYAALIPARDKAFKKIDILFAGDLN